MKGKEVGQVSFNKGYELIFSLFLLTRPTSTPSLGGRPVLVKVNTIISIYWIEVKCDRTVMVIFLIKKSFGPKVLGRPCFSLFNHSKFSLIL